MVTRLQEPEAAQPGLDVLLTTLITAALAAAALYAGRTAPALEVLRYLPLLPVSLAAYPRGGLLTGQIMAGFFSSILLWQAAWGWAGAGLSTTTLELAMAALLLHLVAYGVSSAGASVRGREALADAARGRGALLARAASLDDAAGFLLAEAAALTDARGAGLVLRNPVDASWELAADGRRAALPPGPTLAAWLADQPEAHLIADLDADFRFDLRALPPSAGPRSLLAQPLWAESGTLLGVLVLLDRRGRPFGRRDLARLAPLLVAGSQALAQAGLLARTDRALARRAGQLAAIQQAARDLNAAADAAGIVRRAAACLAEVVAADAAVAVAVAAADGLPLAWAGQGCALAARRPAELAAAARDLRGPTLAPAPALALAGGRGRLAAALRRGDECLGVLIAEAGRENAFDGQDLLAVAALADHAAIALENTRLLARAQAEHRRAEQVIGHMADGLLALDPEGRVTALNPAAEALTGWRPAEAVGRPACQVLGCAGEDAAALAAALAGLRGDAAVQGCVAAGPAAGGRRILGYSAAPLPDGGRVLLIRDVTREQELQAFQRELVATFSHELRAPLANIEALAQALLDTRCAGGERTEGSEPGEAPASTGEYVAMLRAQGRRLAALAERTLDVARLEEGAWRLEPRPLAAARALADAADRWRPTAGERLHAAAAPRLWAHADEVATGIVLDNLVDNALKYAPPETEIVLTAASGPSGYVTLAVADRGPGVPPALRQRIFDRFARGDAAAGGVGLGLYVAQRLVAAMGGRIWVEDAEAGGSRFAFTLPVLTESESEDPDR